MGNKEEKLKPEIKSALDSIMEKTRDMTMAEPLAKLRPQIPHHRTFPIIRTRFTTSPGVLPRTRMTGSFPTSPRS